MFLIIYLYASYLPAVEYTGWAKKSEPQMLYT